MHSRGEKVEDEAYFFIDELEAIIREWITTVYHRRHHRGLCIPEVPGLKLSSLEMFEHGVTRAGPLRIPLRPHLALDFLEEFRVPIHHYGLEVDGLRYNGDGLNGHRSQPSPCRGVDAGKWPIAVDSGDITKAYFQDPKERTWHVLDWEHAAALDGPVSREAVVYARRLAKKTHRFPDTSPASPRVTDRNGSPSGARSSGSMSATTVMDHRYLGTGHRDPRDQQHAGDADHIEAAKIFCRNGLLPPPGSRSTSDPRRPSGHVVPPSEDRPHLSKPGKGAGRHVTGTQVRRCGFCVRVHGRSEDRRREAR
ncbi:hypothetical protein [Streptomyces sp. NPDC017988]|uniref:hypothetical protein n=1 Tax=Streptomyces sp. NPDC017988 TaxID=3365025 RepID=UPI0037939577